MNEKWQNKVTIKSMAELAEEYGKQYDPEPGDCTGLVMFVSPPQELLDENPEANLAPVYLYCTTHGNTLPAWDTYDFMMEMAVAFAVSKGYLPTIDEANEMFLEYIQEQEKAQQESNPISLPLAEQPVEISLN